MNQNSFPQLKELSAIFAITDPVKFAVELLFHCHEKQRIAQPLSNAEQTFCWLREMGRTIANDGFVSVFHEFFTPDSFARICDALAEVGASKLRELLREAWSIYTKDKHPITQEELQSISVRRFNTKEKVDLFNEIGEEVLSELETQYQRGKVWAVEYAKRHHSEFTPVEKTE
ncbi:DMP19 family protein [Verrucomicrobiota bacterium sgz303538]